MDVCAFLLMILPLYPKTVEGHIYSVNLFSYTEATGWIRVAYWILFGGLIECGVVKVVLNRILLLVIKGVLLSKSEKAKG